MHWETIEETDWTPSNTIIGQSTNATFIDMGNDASLLLRPETVLVIGLEKLGAKPSIIFQT